MLARNRIAGRVIGGVMRVLARTLRVSWRGEAHLREAEKRAADGQGGALFAVWHGSLVVPALATRDRDYVVLISRSADGEIATAAMRKLGWRVRRGSGWNGRAEAVRGVLRALREGCIVAVTPDGPRGPSRQAASGVAFLASRTGCALHPVGAAGAGRRLKTWDRLFIPFPFSRAVIVIGAPLDATQSTLETRTHQLQTAIEDCENQAQRIIASHQKRARNARRLAAWNTLVTPLLPAVALYTLQRRFIQKRSAASLRGQWGNVPCDALRSLRPTQSTLRAPTRQSTLSVNDTQSTLSVPRPLIIWLHAVSVGEQIAARPVLRALRHEFPQARIGLSVTTDTGMEAARASVASGAADAAWYFPIDATFAVRRALNRVRPDVFLTMETELWPNFLALAQQRGVRTVLVNGRVSDALLKNAPRFGALWNWMMENFDALLMRSELDAQRLHQLCERTGNTPQRVIVTGDVKLESVPHDAADERANWRAALGIAPHQLLWVAGSTHEGEEDKVLWAWQSLREEFPNLRLLLAPRHVERAGELEKLMRAQNLSMKRRTQLESQANFDGVILLDTIGELGTIYSAADAAFVGGSLIERGGHNVLEPVLRGVPVVFGPHVANFRAAAQLVQENSLGRQVNDEKELRETIAVWLRDESERRSISTRAREALAPHAGAAARVARNVADVLRENRT